MRWSAARITAPDQRATSRLLAFAAAELLLAMAIPFLLIHGYHTILSSNAGTFVDAPTIDEPGWSALVSATPLTAVVEVVDGTVSGAALIVPPGYAPVGHESTVNDQAGTPVPVGPEQGGGTVILMPGDLAIPTELTTLAGITPDTGGVLADVTPSAVGAVLAALLNTDLASVEIVDEAAWVDVMAESSYELDNPDPVPITATTTGGEANDGDGGADSEAELAPDPEQLAFAVGTVVVGGADAAVFLGRPVDGGSLSSVMPRRRRLWSAMLDTLPGGDHPLAATIAAVGATGQLVELPTVEEAGTLMIDGNSAGALLQDVVAFPSGSRLEVRVVDRTGNADLSAVAAQLAGRGIEVVEIANAVQFDDGATEIIRPVDLAEGADQFVELLNELGVDPIIDPEQEHDTVTLLVGREFGLVG